MEDKNTSQPKEKIRFENREQTVLLTIGDFIAAFLAMGIALLVWAKGDTWLGLSLEFLRARIPAWFYFLPLLWMLLLVDSYDVLKASNLKATLKSLGITLIVSVAIYLGIYFASEPNSLPRFGVALFLIVAALNTLLWRLLYIRLFTSASLQKRALIIGAGRAGSALAKIISEQDPPPLTLIGLIDDDPAKKGAVIEGFTVLGNYLDLPEFIEKFSISDLILAISNEMSPGMFQTILTTQERGMSLATMQETYESLTNRVPISLLESDWVIRSFIERKPESEIGRAHV